MIEYSLFEVYCAVNKFSDSMCQRESERLRELAKASDVSLNELLVSFGTEPLGWYSSTFRRDLLIRNAVYQYAFLKGADYSTLYDHPLGVYHRPFATDWSLYTSSMRKLSDVHAILEIFDIAPCSVADMGFLQNAWYKLSVVEKGNAYPCYKPSIVGFQTDTQLSHSVAEHVRNLSEVVFDAYSDGNVWKLMEIWLALVNTSLIKRGTHILVIPYHSLLQTFSILTNAMAKGTFVDAVLPHLYELPSNDNGEGTLFNQMVDKVLDTFDASALEHNGVKLVANYGGGTHEVLFNGMTMHSGATQNTSLAFLMLLMFDEVLPWTEPDAQLIAEDILRTITQNKGESCERNGYHIESVIERNTDTLVAYTFEDNILNVAYKTRQSPCLIEEHMYRLMYRDNSVLDRLIVDLWGKVDADTVRLVYETLESYK